MLTATTTPTIRKMPIPTIATGFLLAIAPLCRRSRAAARAGPCAPPSPIKLSNSQCSARRACPVRAKARTHRPYSLRRGGADRMSGLPDIRHSRTLPCPALRGLACCLARKRGEWSAERRTISFRLAAGARFAKRARHSALHRGVFCPRGRASGRGRGPRGPPIRAAFAALRPRRVQPSKADPRSGAGRRPRASRVRGCEPRPRAPHLPHFKNASRSAPHEQM